MEKVVLFGNSVFAENLFFLLTHDARYQVAAFTVDREYLGEESLHGVPVVPFETVQSLFSPSGHKMLLPISFQMVNRLREEKYLQARAKGYHLISYHSPRATLYPGIICGDNCIILENAVVEPYVRIGNNVIIAAGAIIGHHSVIRDHCFISPGAVILGGATVEERCLIGANASIKEEVTVARECVIGTGASITRNTREQGVYINRPPLMHRKRSDQLKLLVTQQTRRTAELLHRESAKKDSAAQPQSALLDRKAQAQEDVFLPQSGEPARQGITDAGMGQAGSGDRETRTDEA
jgi:sugar O-acyltransferase (sialic acid O-acetyltransferase NeuD family)